MNDRSAYRVQHGSPCERTLGWEALPELGEDRDRNRFRARAWRASLLSLALFWSGLVWLIASAG
jgi:hypothetical protein